MYCEEIAQYCDRNVYAKEWYNRKCELDKMVETFVEKKNIGNPEFNNFMYELGVFSNWTDFILDNDGLVDWFKYCAEYQLSIVYYAAKDYD